MSVNIHVTTSGTQQASQQLAAFTATATSGLNAMSAAAIRAAFASNNLFVHGQRITANTTNLRAGMSALRPILAILGFQTFPQLTGAITLSSHAMRQLQAQAGLTNAQLLRLGVIGATAGLASFGIQKSFEALWEAENKLAETQGAEHNQRQLLATVQKLGEAGAITGKQWRDMVTQLQGTPDIERLGGIRKQLLTILAEQPSAVDLLRSQLNNASARGNTLQASSDTFAGRGLAATGEQGINANLMQQAELWRDINDALGIRQDKLRADLELTDAELAKNKEWLALSNDRADALTQEMVLRRQIKDREKAINNQRLEGTQTMFSNMATAAQAFGKKGLVAYKAFASAAALVDTYRAAIAAYAAMASIPYVGPALGAVAAAAAVAAGMANIAQINSASYAKGGFTGSGADGDVAGIVHRNEFVVPAEAVRSIGVGNLQAMTRGKMPMAGAAPIGAGQPQLQVFFFDSKDAMKRFIESNIGREIIIRHVNDSRLDLGFPT